MRHVEGQMLDVVADASESLDTVGPSERVGGEGDLDALEEAASDEITAGDAGQAHRADVGLGQQGEEAFADLWLRPQAVEALGFGGHGGGLTIRGSYPPAVAIRKALAVALPLNGYTMMELS